MKTLLITGVTGFLGGAVLEKILTGESAVNLLLLARAATRKVGWRECRRICVSSTCLSMHWPR